VVKRDFANLLKILTSPLFSHWVWTGDALAPSLWIATSLYSRENCCHKGSCIDSGTGLEALIEETRELMQKDDC